MPRLKTAKKTVKKVNINDVIESVMDYTDSAIELCDIQEAQIQRIRVAVWALVIYDVVFTGLFLLMLYGNQYLIK